MTKSLSIAAAIFCLWSVPTAAVAQHCRPDQVQYTPQGPTGPGQYVVLRPPNQTRAIAHSASPQVVLTVTACALTNPVGTNIPAILFPNLGGNYNIPIPLGECRTGTGKTVGVGTGATTGTAVVSYCIVTVTPTSGNFPAFDSQPAAPASPGSRR